jgi:hypothetical protein
MDNVQKHNICTNVPSSQTFRPYSYLLLFMIDTVWFPRKWKTCQKLLGTFCSHTNVNDIRKMVFYVIMFSIMLLTTRVFSDTGTKAFSGQGRNWTQQDTISKLSVTLNVKFHNAER